MHTLSGHIYKIWAKTEKGTERTHPLVCHVLDTSAVASVLWDEVLALHSQRIVGDALGLTICEARTWAAFLAGLHDLGKASPVFQAKHPPAVTVLSRQSYEFRPHVYQVPHGTITSATLGSILIDLFNIEKKIAVNLARLAGGHHGVFDSPDALKQVTQDQAGSGQWKTARLEIVNCLAQAVTLQGRPTRRALAGYALLAGLISVADWIASTTDYFPFASTEIEKAGTDEYFCTALEKAKAALGCLGWLCRAKMREPLAFEALFRIPSQRPLQEQCIAVSERLSHPALVIVEAPMGEGKTEAALYMAEKLTQLFGLRGFFIGLPTQATSNQMFTRVKEMFERGCEDGTAHLLLLHGHASLSAEFEGLRANVIEAFGPAGIEPDGNESATVAAGEWFTYRKRGLLAPYGVGTVDQALMGALQSKHVFVRLLGLSGKVIIIDEVHAYDTYMSALLDRLVIWLRSLGSTVILLSATLPEERRRALVRAANPSAEIESGASSYPRVTVVDRRGIELLEFPAYSTSRLVNIETICADPNAIAEWVRDRISGGGCAAVVCNTVRRAQEIYEACKRLMPEDATDGSPVVDLLHSRFFFEDREERELRSLTRFGPPEKARRPLRAVLVATQIIEQSLDLDFDLMVSEMPPIDLLLQRLGRLHRHNRARRPLGGGPTLGLVEVPVDEAGYPKFPAAQKRVYDEHVLLRTWLLLKGRNSITLPDNIRSLVECVYGQTERPEFDSPLAPIWARTLAKLEASRARELEEAQHRYLPELGGMFQLDLLTSMGREDDEGLHPFFRALTRLADKSITLIGLFEKDGAHFIDRACTERVFITALPSHKESIRLLRRSCSLSDRRAVGFFEQQPSPQSWKKSPLLRHCRPVYFAKSGCAVMGEWQLRLCPETGLRIEKDESC